MVRLQEGENPGTVILTFLVAGGWCCGTGREGFLRFSAVLGRAAAKSLSPPSALSKAAKGTKKVKTESILTTFSFKAKLRYRRRVST